MSHLFRISLSLKEKLRLNGLKNLKRCSWCHPYSTEIAKAKIYVGNSGSDCIKVGNYKWRTRSLPVSKEDVQRQLVQVLQARVVQLSSSDGNIVHPSGIFHVGTNFHRKIDLFEKDYTISSFQGQLVPSQSGNILEYHFSSNDQLAETLDPYSKFLPEEYQDFRDEQEDSIGGTLEDKWAAELEQIGKEIHNINVGLVSNRGHDAEIQKKKTRKARSSSYSKTEVDKLGTESKTKNANVLSEETAKANASVTNKKKVNFSPEKQRKAVEHEKDMNAYKAHFFNHDLKCYVDVCVFVRKPELALKVIRGIRQKVWGKSTKEDETHIRKFLEITDVEIYNTLLHGLAKKGQIKTMQEAYNLMLKDKLMPTMQTYATFFECLGRRNPTEVEFGKQILAEMERKELDVREIFNVCKFANDETVYIQKGLEAIIPDYKRNPSPDVESYVGELVEPLNIPLPSKMMVEVNPSAGVLTDEELLAKFREQIQREALNKVSVKSVIETKKNQKMSHLYDSLVEEWKKVIRVSFEAKLKKQKAESSSFWTMSKYPYLLLFQQEDYVNIILEEALDLTKYSSQSPSTSYMYLMLGYTIYEKYIREKKFIRDTPHKLFEVYKSYLDKFADPCEQLVNHRVIWQKIAQDKNCAALMDIPEKRWSVLLMKSLGKFLYEIILKDLKIDANLLTKSPKKHLVPAFHILYRQDGVRLREQIKPHPHLVTLVQNQGSLMFPTTHLPMLVPPLPWTSVHQGGYLLNRIDIIRIIGHNTKQHEILNKTPLKKLNPVLDALNALSSCAWKINKPILDIMLELFRGKGNTDLDIPVPESESPKMPVINMEMSSYEKAKVYEKRKLLRKQNDEMKSRWYTELYRFSIANMFRDEIIWFPHNMDFRGRTYPIPPHFNHIGGDLARGMMVFAKGKPLGPNGLNWLKIHLVNLTGLKKRFSNDMRLAYANELMPEIIDSADFPLTGRKWWQKMEEPWQTLACCMEIVNAIRSPDATKYISHFPVHQDGTCNGLQHYAALGRDKIGAMSVNLAPLDSPQDVYSDVVQLVEEERKKDAADGNHIAQILEGYVERKIIKQTIMTTVYGVTKHGALLQILRQLKDLGNFPREYLFQASGYLTKKSFYCLSQMFTGAREIQEWFTDSARVISLICRQPVEWITPLNFPVLQGYCKPVIMKDRHYGYIDSLTKPDSLKQKNAFPPNFIHSLDSTHMMLTSLYCQRAGINFVSVHDCFWTHAGDVEVMNKVCREQFVSLYNQPVLENLSRYMVEKYCNSSSEPDPKKLKLIHSKVRPVLESVPQKRDFVLEDVLKSTYFFN
ncbi:hypothetical protein CHS0354_040349 [Potamilus streckersoni]|uniref:DNA-directed RNA polymerase n=1 Tax=Potamilus streckersoni TaxID=2493646 RepID=A0AAE0S1A6_9BIVA|nr:hypothetical protein CHS0354_040349 [Potamilus streckersoni]